MRRRALTVLALLTLPAWPLLAAARRAWDVLGDLSDLVLGPPRRPR